MKNKKSEEEIVASTNLVDLVNALSQRKYVVTTSIEGTRYIAIPESLLTSTQDNGETTLS